MNDLKHFQLLIILCIIMTNFSKIYSQIKQDIIFLNNQIVDNDLYKDVEGSPYYFKDWKQGVVKNKDAKSAEKETLLLNYNGYTKSFEIRKDGSFITLDERYYDEVVVKNKQNEAIIFKTGLHPKYPNQFMRLVHKGKDYYLIQDYIVSLNSREKEVYAGKETIKKFIPKPKYFFVKDGMVKIVKLKKKEIIKLLNEENHLVKEYITTKKPRFNQEKDLINIFQFYDEIQNEKEVTLEK